MPSTLRPGPPPRLRSTVMTDGGATPDHDDAPAASAPARALSSMDHAFLTGVPEAGELVLVRHGQQDYPSAGTRSFSAWVDPRLSATGERQAEAVGRALAGRPVAAVYSSHLQRAHATGRAIARHHRVEVVVDTELREIEMFRDLDEGQSPVEALGADRLREAQERFVATRRWDAYPATETGAELKDRVVRAVEAAVAAHPGGTVVVACHGGVINAYLVHVLGLQHEDMFFRPAHASVHRVAFAGGRRVVGVLNEVHHLQPAEELLTW